MSDFDTWHFNPIATKGQICYKYANLLSKCELLPAEVRETEETRLKANMLNEGVRRWIWQKNTTKQNKKKGKDVERESEKVDLAKNTTKEKGKNNNNKTNKNTTKMLKERVRRWIWQGK